MEQWFKESAQGSGDAVSQAQLSEALEGLKNSQVERDLADLVKTTVTKQEFADFANGIRQESADICKKSLQEGDSGMKHDIETLKIAVEQVSKFTTSASVTPSVSEIKQEVKRDVDECLRAQIADAEAKTQSMIAGLRAEVQDSVSRLSEQS